MSLITPDLGLIFWQVLGFLGLLIILGKFAWKPILAALHEREESIATALSASSAAKSEVEALKAEVAEMKNKARSERETILSDAKKSADKVIADAQDAARLESDRITKAAQESIQAEKRQALAEIKKEVSLLSIEIAEKILKQNLSTKEDQKALVQTYLQEVSKN